VLKKLVVAFLACLTLFLSQRAMNSQRAMTEAHAAPPDLRQAQLTP
jgi:hypothetical protein